MIPRSPVRFVLLAAASLTLPGAVAAQDTTRSTTERIEELEQQIRILARLREIELDSAVQAARGRPTVNTSGDGFFFRSADGNWRLRIGGYIQADARFYPGDDAGILTNTLGIRRARPLVEGTVYQYFDFRILPDFGAGTPSLYEAYLEARIGRALSIRAGKYKPPVGLERLQSATDLRFVERGFPTNLAPNRDVGLQIGGEVAGGTVSYQAGIFNGVPDLGFGDADANDAKDLAGRIFFAPFARQGRAAPVDLGFGVSGSIGNERGTIAAPQTSNLRTPGQAVFFRYRTGATAAAAVIADGRRTRLAPQAYLYRGSLGLLTEYTSNHHTVRRDSVVQTIRHQGWQVAGSFFLTGEKASSRGVTPMKVFDPKAGTWGAVEIAGRVQQTGVDDAAFPFLADPATAASWAKAWSLGINWHFAKNVKLMVDYEHTTFTGGAANGANRPVETFIVTRFQTAF